MMIQINNYGVVVVEGDNGDWMNMMMVFRVVEGWLWNS